MHSPPGCAYMIRIPYNVHNNKEAPHKSEVLLCLCLLYTKDAEKTNSKPMRFEFERKNKGAKYSFRRKAETERREFLLTTETERCEFLLTTEAE